ncbi:Cgl0159 family (beta/alpha)8-fold protein [Actinotalea subterranea]|uniref:Cgl0159 family (beta/alpha)8-fold protein n=1 Tax=Actinotalea subterranea TaxID=2607497 RepID=UPI0011EBBF99|nr:deoxyribose-phosphate aldolase [Actinotalea subterranea]
MTSIADIPQIRAYAPERIAEALGRRPRGRMPEPGTKLMIIAADHAARGVLAAGHAPMAMADRTELLERCMTALARPGVHGFLGTSDVVEDLALLGALDGMLVLGSMNRGGLAGASFEMDDRFTGYDAEGVRLAGLDGGKMLLRIDDSDPGSLGTIEACARAVDALAERRLTALVEPFISRRVDGRVRNVLTTEDVVRSVAIASGLGRTSAYTWLKVPMVDQMERVVAASTMPALVLGGEVTQDTEATLEGWGRALALPGVAGLVIGRSLLYPPDGDVAAAVDRAVGLL